MLQCRQKTISTLFLISSFRSLFRKFKTFDMNSQNMYLCSSTSFNGPCVCFRCSFCLYENNWFIGFSFYNNTKKKMFVCVRFNALFKQWNMFKLFTKKKEYFCFCHEAITKKSLFWPVRKKNPLLTWFSYIHNF
jgi:hypothetical protein